MIQGSAQFILGKILQKSFYSKTMLRALSEDMKFFKRVTKDMAG